MLKDVILELYFSSASIKYVVLNILHLVPFGTGETKRAHDKRCQRLVEQTLVYAYNSGGFNQMQVSMFESNQNDLLQAWSPW